MAVAARRLEAAEPLPAPRPRRSGRPQPGVRSEPQHRRRPARARGIRVTRPLLWIGVIGGLLTGIVALNVAVLQLRIERGRISSEIEKLRAENDRLRAELSTAKASGRIESLARGRLGLVESGEVVYLRLPSSGGR
jgi:cell division protein FtsL